MSTRSSQNQFNINVFNLKDNRSLLEYKDERGINMEEDS